MSSTVAVSYSSRAWVEDDSAMPSEADCISVVIGDCSVDDEEDDEKKPVIFDPIDDMSEGSVVSSLLA